MLVDRREVLRGTVAAVAALATGFGAQAQRVAQPVALTARYVMSRGVQTSVTLPWRVDGSWVAPSDVTRVVAVLASGTRVVLQPWEYVLDGQSLVFGEDLQRWVNAGWIEQLLVQHT